MWGINEYGQLGTEDNFTMISKPCKLLISKEDRCIVFAFVFTIVIFCPIYMY